MSIRIDLKHNDAKQERRALVIVGPTAVGKSDYAVERALEEGGEIVSADSMQVYTGLDKGTSKPTEEERRGVPHHLIDVWDPRENHSVAEFATLARRVIEEIFERGKTPVICGGSGLYVNALLYDMEWGGQGDETERGNKDASISAEDAGALYRALVRRDPLAAWTIHPNNTKRIRRALERLDAGEEEGGLREFAASFAPTAQFTPEIIRLTMDRARLRARIDRRVDAFMEAGLAAEVEGLLASGVRPESTAMQGIGYKEIAAHLAGEFSLEEAVKQIKTHTHQLAKRQETWFRRLSGPVKDIVIP